MAAGRSAVASRAVLPGRRQSDGVYSDLVWFKSVDDVVKAAKDSPGKLSVGFWQSNVLVTGEIFQQAAGVQFLKVPEALHALVMHLDDAADSQ